MITLIILATIALWFVFVFLMALKHRAERESWPMWSLWILRALFVVGYVYDVIYNTFAGTMLFWECPHGLEPLTSRLKRHYFSDGYRGNLSRFFCNYLVHPNDPGHCC